MVKKRSKCRKYSLARRRQASGSCCASARDRCQCLELCVPGSTSDAGCRPHAWPPPPDLTCNHVARWRVPTAGDTRVLALDQPHKGVLHDAALQRDVAAWARQHSWSVHYLPDPPPPRPPPLRDPRHSHSCVRQCGGGRGRALGVARARAACTLRPHPPARCSGCAHPDTRPNLPSPIPQLFPLHPRGHPCWGWGWGLRGCF